MPLTGTRGRSAIDVLPLNVAILDASGEIVETNRSWDEFAGETDAGVGSNYLSAASGGDEYGRRAVEGIEAVASGEREEFTMEYPCHTADERQWFQLRAGRFRMNGQRRIVVAHTDVTERKLAERAAEGRAASLEHLVDRLKGLVEEVTRGLLKARSREAVERRSCEHVAAVEPYEVAAVWRPEHAMDALAVATCVGADLEGCTVDLGPTPVDPVVDAFRTSATRFVQDVEGLPLAPSESGLAGRDHGGVAAVPLVYDETRYGVLAVYTDEPAAFDRREQVVLGSLGRMVAHAVNDRQAKRLIAADEVVELTFETGVPFLARLSTRADCGLSHRGTAIGRDAQRLHVEATGAPAEAVVAEATELEGVAAVDPLATYDETTSLLEFRLTDDALVTVLADHGAETRSIEAADGTATVEATFPQGGGNARAVTTLVEERYDAELTGYRERVRPNDSRRSFRERVVDGLTERQRAALERAYVWGFFEPTRRTSGDELAASMDISRSTFHQHLRAAERKVFAALLDPEPSVPEGYT